MITLKKQILPLFMLFLLVFTDCKPYKSQLLKKGDRNQVVQNTIIDFSNTSRLFAKDSVFFIEIYDTLHRMVLEKFDEDNFRWIRGKVYKDILAITIIGSDMKYLINDSSDITKNKNLPSMHIQKDGKLFIWNDESQIISDETLSILHEYNLITYDYLYDYGVDDAKKGVNYYICRNNLLNYKKITGNLAIGYYDAPKLNCSSSSEL
jgi:hypothetical protein